LERLREHSIEMRKSLIFGFFNREEELPIGGAVDNVLAWYVV
jgi:hypothetical protein